MLQEKDVITAINNILSEVSAIKKRYDHIPAQYEAFPAAYVIPATWEKDYIDLRDTGISATFKIGIVYTLDPDIKEAQIQLRETVADVRDELKKQENIQLGGTVDWSQLTSGTYSFDTKDQRVAMCEITISVRKRYSRYE